MSICINEYITIQPIIYHTNKTQLITIKALYSNFSLDGLYDVSIVPKYYYFSNDRLTPIVVFNIAAENNCLTIEYAFKEEQEYLIAIRPANNSKQKYHIMTSVYAVDDDLYSLFVLKGDLHMHTSFSDGIETPQHRVMMSRKNGFDFIAITDHNSFEGSVAAQKAVDYLGLDMIALHGEEVHALNCPLHILSLGAKESVVSKVACKSEELVLRRKKLHEEYKTQIPNNVSAEAYIAAIDVFQQIHIAGGLSVLCHIFWDAIDWNNGYRFGSPQQLVDSLVVNPLFDVFEITSGAPKKDLSANYMQDAYYREKLPKSFPIIGITDTHCTLESETNIFGKNYTIVFTFDKSEAGILDAIKNYRSISVDGVGENVILRGSLRLCKYAKFLINCYFPFHDKCLLEEGVAIDRVLKYGEEHLDNMNISFANTKNELKKQCQGIRVE